MAKDRWFPQRHRLPGDVRLGRLLFAGNDWQIYQIDQDTSALIVKSALIERWIASDLLSDAVMFPFTFGSDGFGVVTSGAGQQLAPINESGSPQNKTDALSFAISLHQTRILEPTAPLQDAIFIERYSRLLPTWTVSESVEDDTVLGSWLTGGVKVSATSFRRLRSLVGWLNEQELRDIVNAAGPTVAISRGRQRLTGANAETDESGAEAKLLALHHANATTEHEPGQPTASTAFRLPGRAALETFFNEHVIDIVVNAERYKALGIDFPAPIVLYGPPGCGKTFAVDRLVEYLDWPIYRIDPNSVGSPYIHETSRKISSVFDMAIDSTPSVVVIDEMESFLSDRQIDHSGGLYHVEEVGEFLRRIPEAAGRGVLIIGMTNRLEMIDAAILRRGRFDHVIEVSMPTREEIVELMATLLKKIPLTEDLATEHLIAALLGRPLSDVAFAVREASRIAAKAGGNALDQMSLDAAIAALPPIDPKTLNRQIGFKRN